MVSHAGGERKRVSVGHELLINPAVLLLVSTMRMFVSSSSGLLKYTSTSFEHLSTKRLMHFLKVDVFPENRMSQPLVWIPQLPCTLSTCCVT